VVQTFRFRRVAR